MESENANGNEASNTVTENAPDMNEFEQSQPVEAVETVEENKALEETTEVIEETAVEDTNTVNKTEEETSAEVTNETVNETTEQKENEANNEVTEVINDANEKTEEAENTVNEETEKITNNNNEETEEEQKPENEEPTQAVQTENNEPSHETDESNTIAIPTETTKITETNENENETNNNGDNIDKADNTNNNDNKESLIVEEVTIASPINNIDNISEMNTDVAENMPTEESPITEIANAPIEQNTAEEAYEEQVNPTSNDYYSSNRSSANKSSIVKPVGVENYKFSSEPRAIPAPSQRRKYRDPFELEKMMSIQKNEFNQEKQKIVCNIMYDPRVVRGNTYAAKNLPLRSEPDPLERHKQEEMKRRAKARKRAAEKRRIKTPEPVEGRRHVEIQTDLYLEELYDKVPEAIAATQTDLFLDRAPSPLYIPQKSGVDATTQIYDGELFDFNFEVEPILEVLVGKTLEQALIEVMEEEELEMLRRHQVEFEEKRNAELAEVQRLEDAERRRNDEKNRRIAEKLKLMEEKKEVAEKIAARSFTKAYLSNLIPSVFETLNDNGFFYDPRETEIENYFLPWLTHKSNNYVDKIRTSRLLLDHIILDSIKQLNDMGRPILKGLKERKHKKKIINVPKDEWMNPNNIFKCLEFTPSKY